MADNGNASEFVVTQSWVGLWVFSGTYYWIVTNENDVNIVGIRGNGSLKLQYAESKHVLPLNEARTEETVMKHTPIFSIGCHKGMYVDPGLPDCPILQGKQKTKKSIKTL